MTESKTRKSLDHAPPRAGEKAEHATDAAGRMHLLLLVSKHIAEGFLCHCEDPALRGTKQSQGFNGLQRRDCLVPELREDAGANDGSHRMET